MSNFGTRLAYPVEHEAAPRPRLEKTGVLARMLAALTRALDEAPFDLAWPPSPRNYERRRIG